MLQTVRYLIGTVGPSGFGSKTTADDVTESCHDLRSLTAIITGATSGIGAEVARVLARRGARLVLPARNLKAAEESRARIAAEFPDSQIFVMALDLSSLSSVMKFVSEFESLNLPLNILINNAGKFTHNHTISDDGIEMTIATNYLGHFLLTKLLLNKMVETAESTGVQGRIVNVTSGIHGWVSGDVIQNLEAITRNKSHYDATQAYALSKLCNVLHTRELADRLKEMGANVTANCVNPGVVRTRLTREREGFITDLVFFLASKLLKTIPQAAATTCYAAVHPRLLNMSGKYLVDCNEGTPAKQALSSTEAARLWAFSDCIVCSEDPKAAWGTCLSSF
ncbi:hypothetical protein SAY87_014530 [Trapa incisa]|uniref:Uncharacterized protein n=2 Tax=Trapa TaxID=22665 RepID=A0AAN7RHH6_TRANT|nr:hypothetical protein SAY87_014530 [Trapa incisa]KAK4803090.1 hypothetical protein SAY86_001293 [Trapa natans]